jgi:hypothetical protein
MSDEAKMIIVDGPWKKALASKHYNYVFDKKTGFFARWGQTKEEDPDFSPFGPEILDLEIDSGECLGNCKFCYKSNGSGVPSKHMSLEDFKTLLDKMPKTLKTKINIELENKTLVLSPENKVLLKDGTIKIANNLEKNDDLKGFYRGSELIFLE